MIASPRPRPSVEPLPKLSPRSVIWNSSQPSLASAARATLPLPGASCAYLTALVTASETARLMSATNCSPAPWSVANSAARWRSEVTEAGSDGHSSLVCECEGGFIACRSGVLATPVAVRPATMLVEHEDHRGGIGAVGRKFIVMGDIGSFIALSLTAMLNPTLLAAATVMMLLPETKRLMLGYLLGSYLTSISVGLLIAFSLHRSGSVESARTTLTPAEDLVF